jgi:deoxyribonuclease V
METGGRPESGVCAAVDVHYLRAGGARAAAVLAADAVFAHMLAERIAVIPQVPPYRPGEFYLRELPPLRAVLDGLSGLGLLVVDGYADLDPGGRPGLGARAYAEFGIPVIGVAKSRFRTATHAVPVVRGSSARPLFVTAAGMHRADLRRCAICGRCGCLVTDPLGHLPCVLLCQNSLLFRKITMSRPYSMVSASRSARSGLTVRRHHR